MFQQWKLSLCVILLLAVGGCGQVQRQMVIHSNPEGALVHLNGQEVGRTPLTVDFTWYGTYDLVLRQEGYQALRVEQRVYAPWWQWIPFDLLSELTPGRKVDRREFTFAMLPHIDTPLAADELIQRAAAMRPLLESSPSQNNPDDQKQDMQTFSPATEPITAEPLRMMEDKEDVNK